MNLGSGSSGNCSLLQATAPGRCRRLLVDCGFSIRRTRSRLDELEIELDSIDGIVLTHLDRDHFNPSWIRTLDRLEVPIHVAPRHLRDAHAAGIATEQWQPHGDCIDFGDGLTAEPINLSHDESGCSAYRFEFEGHRLGFATDLGHVPDALLEFFTDLDMLAFESNYDRSMQLESDRPEFLKERIMGGSGHLSNEQSLHAILHMERTSSLRHIMLLHLSQQCNDRERICELYTACAPHLLDRLVITRQHVTSAMVEIKSEPSPAG